MERKMKYLWPLLLLISSYGYSQEAKIGEKAYQNCILCHGQKGEGVPDQQGPRIGGQFDWYIETQIKNFLSGKRQNPKMMPYIKGLSERDIKDISAYVSTLKI
jgi:cytochrome c553